MVTKALPLRDRVNAWLPKTVNGGRAVSGPEGTQPGGHDGPAIAIAGLHESEDVASLLVAVDTHYLGPAAAPTLQAARAMVVRTLAEREGTLFALARQGGRPVAVACFARVRPGHQLQGVLWLKELFVVEEARGRGIGRAMLAFLADYARREGLGRIDLTTERDNVAAQRFYERIGGVQKAKVFYRFEGEALAALMDEPR